MTDQSTDDQPIENILTMADAQAIMADNNRLRKALADNHGSNGMAPRGQLRQRHGCLPHSKGRPVMNERDSQSITYGEPQRSADHAIWCALRDRLCPGYRICRHWIAGGGCCGEVARQAVAEWERDNG